MFPWQAEIDTAVPWVDMAALPGNLSKMAGAHGAPSSDVGAALRAPEGCAVSDGIGTAPSKSQAARRAPGAGLTADPSTAAAPRAPSDSSSDSQYEEGDTIEYFINFRGKLLTAAMSPEDRLIDLKSYAASRCPEWYDEVAVTSLTVKFGASILKDDSATLAQCGIADGSTVDVRHHDDGLHGGGKRARTTGKAGKDVKEDTVKVLNRSMGDKLLRLGNTRDVPVIANTMNVLRNIHDSIANEFMDNYHAFTRTILSRLETSQLERLLDVAGQRMLDRTATAFAKMIFAGEMSVVDHYKTDMDEVTETMCLFAKLVLTNVYCDETGTMNNVMMTKDISAALQSSGASAERAKAKAAPGAPNAQAGLNMQG